jgi:secondary thiamine-phosphate synthase enzyme
MAWLQREIQLSPLPRGFHPITRAVVDAVPEIAQIRVGLLHIFLQHTSASLGITENADPDVLADLERVSDKVAPEDFLYRHADEGPDDMPSHVKSLLLGCSLTVPIRDGRLCLGTWQGICLGEHRRRAGRRKLVLTVWGDADEK